jgi:hypothetical protein
MVRRMRQRSCGKFPGVGGCAEDGFYRGSTEGRKPGAYEDGWIFKRIRLTDETLRCGFG